MNDSPVDCQNANETEPQRERPRHPENKRISAHKQPTCHSERREARVPTEVELLRVERSEQAKVQGVAAAGYGLKFRWLATGMLHRFKSYPNSEPYPFVAVAPRFCSVFHSAKLRLRASPFAQNDI